MVRAGDRWMVDANNVMGSRPDGWWSDRGRAMHRLVDEITRWRTETRAAVTVVVDGYPDAWVPEGNRYGVDVRYAHSRARDAADGLIVDLLESEADPSAWTVATSDRALRDSVTALGASTEGARTFLERLAAIEPRRADRAVLERFGIDESTLLGRGGEARVFAIDDERVLRLPHPDYPADALAARRKLLESFAGADIGVRVPEILDEISVDGRLAIIERRLPGENALEALGRARDRAGLVVDHLEVASRLAELPYPGSHFGELWGEGAIRTESFHEWATARAAVSLDLAGATFAAIDAKVVADEMIAALPEPEPAEPRLVHLDAFLGNMLAAGDRITAVLDFGPMTIGGPPILDPLIAVAYLAEEITPTATDRDRAVARAWADERGLGAAVDAAERWIAAYWTGAVDDQRLQDWCRRILLG